MSNREGWISIHRAIQDNWIWKDGNKLKWWLDILLTVNTNTAKVNIGNEIYDCKRGESLLSIQSWANRWGVSKDTARNFLNLLEKDNMITRVNLGKTTRLTVCKYDSYQQPLHVKPTTAVRSLYTNNKEDKENKESIGEKPIGLRHPFDKFWDAYDKKVGEKNKIEKKWTSLKDNERELAMSYLPKYKESQPNKKYRLNPETFLNQKGWNNELIGLEDDQSQSKIDFSRTRNSPSLN
jgi:hypothetical protein